MKYKDKDLKTLEHGDTIQCNSRDELLEVHEQLKQEGYSAWIMKQDKEFIIFIAGREKL